MNFNLTDEQKIIQSTAREFALSEILPGMEKKKFMSKLQNMIEKESKSLLNK